MSTVVLQLRAAESEMSAPLWPRKDLTCIFIPSPPQLCFVFQARFVSRSPAKFIWAGKSINDVILKSDVIVNHFPKAKYFSSKVCCIVIIIIVIIIII